MKTPWLSIRRNLPIWLGFFFLYTLPMLISSISFEFGPLGVGSQALDHVGGSSWWYTTLFWMSGHLGDCAKFATIAWAVYKIVILLLNKYKRK